MPRPSLQTRHARQNRAAVATAAERKELFEQMNQALRDRVNSMEVTNTRTTQSSVAYYYSVGQQCHEIASMPAVYGATAIADVERYFSTTGLQLRKCRQFAETYTEEQMRQLIEFKNEETNFCLNWGHIVVLLSVPVAGDREKLVRKAVNGNWEVAKLRKYVQDQRGGKDPRNTGRPHQVPATLEGQVRQITAVSQTWLKKGNDVWDGDAISVIRNVRDAEPEQVNEELLAELQLAIDAVEEIGRQSVDFGHRLTELQNSLRGKLVTKKAREREVEQESATARPRNIRVAG